MFPGLGISLRQAREILVVARSVYTIVNPVLVADSRSVATWLRFCECHKSDAIITNLKANGAGADNPISEPSLPSLRCYDPSALRYFATNLGTRVAPLKDGLVELGGTTKLKRLKKGGRWRPSLLSLNEVFLSTFSAHSSTAANLRTSVAGRASNPTSIKVDNPLNSAGSTQAGERQDNTDDGEDDGGSSASTSGGFEMSPLEHGLNLKDICKYLTADFSEKKLL